MKQHLSILESLPASCPVCGKDWKEKYGRAFSCDEHVKYLMWHESFKPVQVIINIKNAEFVWFPFTEEFAVFNANSAKHSQIPYFIPDFSDFNKLINKLSTYLSFI